jgi:heme exporter protein C
MNLFKYASPQTFYPLAGKLIPWFAVGAAILIIYGLYIGLLIAPTDFQQGDSYRIIYIHVPAAWFSMFLYVVLRSLQALFGASQLGVLGGFGMRA